MPTTTSASLVFFVLLFFSTCSIAPVKTANLITNINENITPINKTDFLELPDSNKFEYPHINKLKIDISESPIYLISEKEDSEGYSIPPYNQAEIQNVGFSKKPMIGSFAMVIPLEVNIAPINLRILTRKRRIENKNEVWWETELEKTTKKEFLEALPISENRRKQYPFDVCVLYPAIKKAKAIPRKDLNKNYLPHGIEKNLIYAALDIDQDNQPDFVIVRYCQSGSDAMLDCEFNVSDIFVKNGGSWKVFRKESS